MPDTAERNATHDSAAEVGKACAHPVRTDILTVLDDGPACASDLSREVDEPLNRLAHHITELLKVNAIEVAYTNKVGNHDVIFYRPLKTSTYLAEDLAQLTWEQQNELNRTILLSITAEALAALSAGHFAGDPLVSAAWDYLLLDKDGYRDLSSSTLDFLNRIHEIAAEASIRMEMTGETPSVYVGAVLGFKRSRVEPATRIAVDNAEGIYAPRIVDQRPARDSAAEVGKACAHPMRTDILTVLHDGSACASDMAKEIGVTLSKLGYHIDVLLKANAIEVDFTKEVGNHDVIFYRPLKTSTYLAEDLAQLTWDQQHDLNRTILLSITAEAFAALRAGHFAGDPLASAAWDRLSLDRAGYEKLSSSTLDFLNRTHEIAAEAEERMQMTNEAPKAYIGAVLGFKRSRTGPATRAAVDLPHG